MIIDRAFIIKTLAGTFAAIAVTLVLGIDNPHVVIWEISCGYLAILLVDQYVLGNKKIMNAGEEVFT